MEMYYLIVNMLTATGIDPAKHEDQVRRLAHKLEQRDIPNADYSDTECVLWRQLESLRK